MTEYKFKYQLGTKKKKKKCRYQLGTFRQVQGANYILTHKKSTQCSTWTLANPIGSCKYNMSII